MTEADKRQRVITIALGYVGVKEDPPGSNNVAFNTRFYGREVRDGDHPGAFYPWCATSYCEIFREAGLPIGNVGYLHGFASVPYAVDNIHKWGRLVDRPQPGDAVIYYFGKKTPQHIGMFYQDGPKMRILEGNTGFGNDSNGGEFMIRERLITEDMIFVRPNCLDLEIKTA